MRFARISIPTGYEKAWPHTTPKPKAVPATMKYNETLQLADVLSELNSLYLPWAGVRVPLAARRTVVTDGPFAEAKEMIGG